MRKILKKVVIVVAVVAMVAVSFLSVMRIRATTGSAALDIDTINGIPLYQEFLPYSQQHRPGKSMTPQYITIHNTDNNDAGADAEMHSRYLHGVTAEEYVSWHFTVDNNEIIQHLPLNEIGYHAGDGGNGLGNMASIAIEICENNDGNYAKAEMNTTKLVANLLFELNMDVSQVVPHQHWSGKQCPHNLLYGDSGSMGWSKFIETIQKELTVLEIQKASIPTMEKLTLKKDERRNLLLSATAGKDFTIEKNNHEVKVNSSNDLFSMVTLNNKYIKYNQTVKVTDADYEIKDAKKEFDRLFDNQSKITESGATLFDAEKHKFTNTGLTSLTFDTDKGQATFLVYNYIAGNPRITTNAESFIKLGSGMNLLMSKNTDIDWEIENEDIAIIKNGVITGKKVGKTKIIGKINGIKIERILEII